MNSILSAISGRFTQSLVLGTLFPATLFVVIALATVGYSLPSNFTLIMVFQTFDKEWKIILIISSSVLLSGFLHNLNFSIIRFYEGYSWRSSWIAQNWRTPHYRAQFAGAVALIPRLRLLRNDCVTMSGFDREYTRLQGQLDRLGQVLSLALPHEQGLILPTRLGNVVRSAETYSHKQYEMDAILFWPRLCQVVSKDNLAAAEDAKSSMDFFLNASLLSGALAILFASLAAGSMGTVPFPIALRLTAEALAAAFCSYGFYLSGVSRAAVWGAEVRTMFDLFRWDLLKKLGHQQVPSDRAAERRIWTALTKQYLYGDPPPGMGQPLAYKDPAEPRTRLILEPSDAEISLSSGALPCSGEECHFVHRVFNGDSQRRTVCIQLVDSLIEGYVYMWGSAKVREKDSRPLGTNPLSIDLGAVAYGCEIEVSYLVMPLIRHERKD